METNTEKPSASTANPFTELTEDLQDYVRVQSEILRLEVTDKFAASSSYLTLIAGLALITFLFVLFLGLAAGFYLAEVLGSTSKGFLIVTAIILFKLIIVLIFRKQLITNPIRNKIIQKSFNRKKTADEN